MAGKNIYNNAVEQIKAAILKSQYTAAKQVNAIQLSLYYGIGQYVSLNSRKGFWGTNAIEFIAEQLKKELPGLRGFSARNIRNMRKFWEEWHDLLSNSADSIMRVQSVGNEADMNLAVATAKLNIGSDCNLAVTTAKSEALVIPQFDDVQQSRFLDVPFTHHIKILEKVKDREARLFYIRWTADNLASVDKLAEVIASDLYGKGKGQLPNNFDNTITDSHLARKAVMMFKDEYLLDFINVEEIGERDKEDIDERIVEKEIVHNVKNFIMTFGKNFTFVGNQYHLEKFGVDQYPDLLFFNRELNCLVCVDLKKGNFKPAYLGQLTTYLRMLDDTVRLPHENPAIGIILCKGFNKEFVEYIIQDYNKPMGVARYSTTADMPEKLKNTLPDMEQLRNLLIQSNVKENHSESD